MIAVLSVFAGVLTVGAVDASPARAAGESCTKVSNGADVLLSGDGFVDGDSVAIRRNGRWVATLSAVDFAYTGEGTVDDEWTLRARGDAFETPYTPIECVAGLVEPPPNPDVTCLLSDDGLTWDDAGADRYQVRRNGRWVATTNERSFITGDLDAAWVIRYRIGDERIDIVCESDDGPVDPEPSTPVDCRIIQAGLEWDEPANVSGDYQVRRNGTWVASESNRYFLGETAEGSWTVRYRVDGERVESSCVVADFGPCVINGAAVESILNGAQCAFLETMLLANNSRPGVDEGLFGEPCDWGPFLIRLDCEDGRVTGLFIDQQLTYADGLRHFADLKRLGPEGFGFNGITPEIGALVNLEEWELSAGGFTELPQEIGRLRSLRFLDLSDSELVSLPPEIAGLQQLETLVISGTWRLSELPPEIGELDALKTIFALDTGLVALPPQVGEMESLETIELIFAESLVELPAEIWDAPNLKVLRVQYSPLTEIPLATTPPTSLTLVDFSDATLSGDQTDWLQSLGEPGDVDVILSNLDCLAEILDPAWNAWVSQQSPDWLNCE